MRGFEAEGSAAIVRGEVIKNPETVATAIRIGNPASWDKAVLAAEESAGKLMKSQMEKSFTLIS